MLMNRYQAYTVAALRQLKYIRYDQLAWLMQRKFGSTESHIQRNIRQLRYANFISLAGEDRNFVCLPGRKRDDEMLSAIDVMFSICGDTPPEFTAGTPPCKLTFFVKDDRGYLDFKVVPVAPGEERPIVARLAAQSLDFICTYLFLIENEDQIPLLATKYRAYYVIPTDKGGYTFFKKKAGG